MRLNVQTDYALRVLMRLAITPGELVTIEAIATQHDISRSHLMKVARQLGQLGFIETVRGRTGGLRLTRDPSDIRIGEVVRQIEPDFAVVECFQSSTPACVISPSCHLKGLLAEAVTAFIDALNRHTLDELSANRRQLADLLQVAI